MVVFLSSWPFTSAFFLFCLFYYVCPIVFSHTGISWDPSRCYGYRALLRKSLPRKQITVWFLAWDRRLECLSSNPHGKKAISPLTLNLTLTNKTHGFPFQLVISTLFHQAETRTQVAERIWINVHVNVEFMFYISGQSPNISQELFIKLTVRLAVYRLVGRHFRSNVPAEI